MTAVLLDFNDARPSGWFSPRQLNNPNYVAEMKAMLEGQAASFLTWLWPNGRVVGNEFHLGSPAGEKGDSFKISLKRGKVGVGCDFAGNEVCGDLIDCAALAKFGRKARGRDFATVCDEIEGYLGRPFKPTPKAAEGKKEDLGPPTGSWVYTDLAGNLLHVVRRYDLPDGKKSFRQSPPMPESGRPLYNLPGVAGSQWVIFVEGEKAAQALIDRGICATCAMAGSKAPPEKTDWGPLASKRVLIWPDADKPGREFATAAADAIKEAGGHPIVMEPPLGVEDGWDAADAVAEGFPIEEYLSSHAPAEKQTARRVIDLERWKASGFAGEPAPIEWTIEGVMPRAVAGVFAAMGDAGKGFITLDLALKIALPRHDADGVVLDDGPSCLGGRVTASGAAVIFAAEDDRDTIHRRLHSLDPDGRRFDPACRLYVVPLPNDGGPLPLVKTSSTVGPYVTPEWEELRARLVAIENLQLIAFDPLASFIHADINADPAAGAFVMGLLASLATETGATVLIPHHMAKRQGPITTPEEARAAIRGSTSLVDNGRFAYAMWQVEEAESRRICAAAGVEWARNRVFKGAIVKSNAPADRTIRILVRNDSGLLMDRTDMLRGDRAFQREIDLDALCTAVETAANAGYPYSKSGTTGIYERRGELPDSLADLGKHTLRTMIDDLLAARRIAHVRYKGQSSPWLDSPDGAFASGVVDLNPGVYRPR